MRKYPPRRTLWPKLFLIIAVVLTTVILPAAIPLAQADEPILLPPDSDLDGLTDKIENDGWRNERANDEGGGPYQTDPYDADSDDDGLTDGEEMLFNTHPKDAKNPGLHVLYENSFETGEYVFAWTPVKRPNNSSGVFRPHGHKMIALNTAVIRRGTTFVIGGPGTVNGHTVNLSWSDALNKPGVSLSALTISQRNPCGANCNSWSITVPAGGTVGKYKLTASNGQGWTDTLILDVIFEMPGDLSDAQVDAYLYDGDRNNHRDETGIWFYGSGSDPDQDLKIRLYAQKYDLSHFSSFIFDGEEALRYYSGPASKYPSAIEAVHGTTSTWDASDKLARRADEFTCFAYPLTARTSSWNTLFPGGSNLNNQCSNIAGLVTAFHRSVGIPARMVAVDHRNSNFDTSAEIWTRPNASGPYTWYTTRSFMGDEAGGGYCVQTHVAGGYRARISRAEYGRTAYRPYSKVWPSRGGASNGSEWMMVTANENWSETEAAGWPPEYEWVVWDKYKVARNSWFETLAMPYWNQYYQVDQEPTNVGDPDTTNPPAWNDPIPPDWLPNNPPGTPSLSPIQNDGGDGSYAVDWPNVSGATNYVVEEDDNASFTSPVTVQSSGASQYSVNGQPSGTWYYRVRAENAAGTSGWSNTRSVTVSAGFQSLTSAPSVPAEEVSLLSASVGEAEFNKVRLGAVLGEYGLDDDGDGRFEALVIQVQVEVKQAGSYWLQGQLGTEEPSFVGTGGVMAIDEFEVALQPGQQTVNLVFDGLSISRTRINGPYKLMYLLITDVANPTPEDFVNSSLDYKNNSYVTAAYKFNNFETLDAMFARSYSERSIDQKGDGYAEAVEIEVALDIYRPGAYSVTGELYDGNDLLVSQASWSGTGSKATLRFDQIAGSSGPYELRNLILSRADGQGLDELERAYTLGQVTKGEPVSGFTAIAKADSGRISPLGVGVTASTYEAIGVDTNSNSKHDVLQIRVGVQVVTAGSYQLEGWLVDQQGNLVSWAHTGPHSLGVGTHTLNLGYDGRALNDYMRAHGLTSQKFTLVALKLYTGPLKWNSINDEVDVAYTTSTYNRDQFEPAFGRIVIEDYLEQGPNKWTNVGAPWSLVDDGAYATQSHAWRAANANASLETVVDLSDTSNVKLKFRTYHQLFGGSDVAYVKASTNGATWQTIGELTGQLASWKTKVLDLSAFADQPSVYLRFELASAGGASDDFLYIDDVVVLSDNTSDSDNDGLSDVEEGNIGTDPGDPDTDGDGMPDGWEVDNGFDPVDPLANDAAGDADTDGLTNLEEYQHGTDPHDPDSDNDGLPDGWEVQNGLDPLDSTGQNGADGDPDNDQLTNLEEYQEGTYPEDSDTDNDGMPDGWELDNNFNPLVYDAAGDADTDGLTNLEEYQEGTDPQDPDSDNDGLPDGWEVQYDFDPLNSTDQNGANGDPDADEFTNLEEYQQGTHPREPDTDGDGIPDGEDPEPGEAMVDRDEDGLLNDEEVTLGTNPDNPDTDGDGMPDGWEVDNNLNPLVNDAAGDADTDELTNLEEYQHGTNPHSPDSDSDGLPDGWEVQNELDPLDSTGQNGASSDPDNDQLTNLEEYQEGTDPNNSDTDGDGIPDGWEVNNNLNPLVKDAGGDADTDGLTNLKEYQEGTNPQDPDSDNDGLPDGWEVQYDFDPLNSTGQNGANGDPDADGFTNLKEYQQGTHPRKPDTDGDGIPDGQDSHPLQPVKKVFLPMIRR